MIKWGVTARDRCENQIPVGVTGGNFAWFQLHQRKHGIFSRRRVLTAGSGKGNILQFCFHAFLVFSLRRYAWQRVCEKVFKKCRKSGGSIVKMCLRRLLKYSKSWPRKRSLNHRTQHMLFQQALCFNSQQYVLVRRADLEQLKGEAMMLKEFLPRLLRKEVLTALPRLTKTEQGIC